MNKRVCLAIILLLCCCSLFSCASEPNNNLIGKWKFGDSIYQLNEDGTYWHTAPGASEQGQYILSTVTNFNTNEEMDMIEFNYSPIRTSYHMYYWLKDGKLYMRSIKAEEVSNISVYQRQ